MKFPTWFLASLLAASVATAIAKSQSASQELSQTEKWVVARVTAGEIADLSKQFPVEKDRKLSAHFLEDLLTGTLPGVKLHRHGVRIIGAIIYEPIDLKNAQIPCEVWLEHCQFNSTVTFELANFASGLLLDGSRFKEDANFYRIKVGGAAFLSHAVFEGPVNFASADIAGGFGALEAKFQNRENEVSFMDMKVRSFAFFSHVVFEGPVNFSLADIAGAFHMVEAQLRNKEQGANFMAMKVGGAAFFGNTLFQGPVNFDSADIGGDFGAVEAKFQNKEQGADFMAMKVGGAALFANVLFEGPVNFSLADIGGDFAAQKAKFQNKEKEASFINMKVRGHAYFDRVAFEGPVNFSYADFAWLDLSSSFWPKVAAQFRMQGMTYKYVRAVQNNELKSHEALFKLVDQAAYSADVYGNLEASFLRQGYRGDADQAFINGKRRERNENLHGPSWFGSLLLDWLVGYGRRPWQAGIPCVCFVALGCFLFSPEKMESQEQGNTPRLYNRFWYSLGLFLPVVDLQSDRVWKPKQEHTFLRNYMRVQILLGWILIPIVLAALTGLIK